MTEYMYPGVYVEEVERGPRPIEGVPTATAAMLGATERGPLRAGLVGSYAQFQREFGGIFGSDRHMHLAVRGFFENGGRKLFVCRVASATAATAQADLADYLLKACGPGAWGNRTWVKLEDGTTLDGNNVPVGVRLRVAYFPQGVAPYDCFDPANIANPGKPQFVEEYDDVEARHLGKMSSAVIVLERKDGAALDSRPANFNGTLEGGADGASLEAADFAAQGLASLDGDSCRDVALVCAPGADLATQRALVAHCEASRFRFAILDAARGATVRDGLTPRADIADTSYAAFYAPWIKVADPATTGAGIFVPPSGHVMGLYARTDIERGVFKPPAGDILRGVLALEQAFDVATQELLTPRGVDVIRDFPGRGILAWGARTLSSKADWKYVSVRRLFIYLERSIYEGTQWVVFEPNGESLWARVRGDVQQFLQAQWRAGMLQGTKPEEAFFVKCDRTTMSQSDLDLGHLICLVGIAAVKPAEFVIFAIQHLTADSSRL